MSQLTPRALLEGIYRGALRDCDGAALAEGALRRARPRAPVALLVLGKPARALAAGAALALGPSLSRGWLVGPAGVGPAPPLEALPGGHPNPDRRSLAAGWALWRGVRALPPGEELQALIAGGGSALAVCPAPGLSARAKLAAHRALVASGLPIEAVNAVRAHLSRIKGGGLARVAGDRPITVFVLSDVGSGAVASVASGPFSAEPSSYEDCLDLVRGLRGFPAEARRLLEAGARGLRPETARPKDACLRRVRVRRLAGPLDLARAAARRAERLGLAVRAERAPLRGPLERVAERIARWASAPHAGPTLHVAVGEPIVALPAGHGVGGRAQQLALRLAPALRGRRAALLVAGSDGHDADSPFAGALVDGRTADRALALGISIERAQARFDVSPAVAKLGIGLPAFESGTNLTDLVLLWRG